MLVVSEFPHLPKLPEILLKKEKDTTKGTNDFSVFSLRCQVFTATETNVKYELQWVINGAITNTISFISTDATNGQFESVLSGDSLKYLQKIDQVSEHVPKQISNLIIYVFIFMFYIHLFYRTADRAVIQK